MLGRRRLGERSRQVGDRALGRALVHRLAGGAAQRRHDPLLAARRDREQVRRDLLGRSRPPRRAAARRARAAARARRAGCRGRRRRATSGWTKPSGGVGPHDLRPRELRRSPSRPSAHVDSGERRRLRRGRRRRRARRPRAPPRPRPRAAARAARAPRATRRAGRARAPSRRGSRPAARPRSRAPSAARSAAAGCRRSPRGTPRRRPGRPGRRAAAHELGDGRLRSAAAGGAARRAGRRAARRAAPRRRRARSCAGSRRRARAGPSSRRTRKARKRSDGRSHQCRSSIASSSGCSALRLTVEPVEAVQDREGAVGVRRPARDGRPARTASRPAPPRPRAAARARPGSRAPARRAGGRRRTRTRARARRRARSARAAPPRGARRRASRQQLRLADAGRPLDDDEPGLPGRRLLDERRERRDLLLPLEQRVAAAPTPEAPDMAPMVRAARDLGVAAAPCVRPWPVSVS